MTALTQSLAVVSSALRHGSTALKLSEDGRKVTRAAPIPKVLQPGRQTVHVTGLPTDATLDAVTAFFNKKSSDGVAAVRLYRKNGKPTGSAFVEFTSVDTARHIATLDRELRWNDEDTDSQPLEIQMKNSYFKSLESGSDDKKRKSLGENGDAQEDSSKKESTQQQQSTAYENDRLLKLTGLVADTTRESIRDYFTKHASTAEIAWIDYEKGDSEAVIRLNDGSTTGAEAVAQALQAATPALDEATVTYVALTGDDEKSEWQKIQSAKKARRVDLARSKRSKRQRR